jgi:hypothetical protein
MLKLDELKKMQEKAYQSGYDTRMVAADDMVFAWKTQWDDDHLNNTDLSTRFEFNIIRKAQRQILTDLILNPIQVDFDPVDDAFEKASEIMDGAYRADMRNNKSQEAKKNANQEAVVCGMGAWKLTTEYRNNLEDDDRQRIIREPIYEANNRVFFDPNARLIDKSDARYVAVLYPYTHDGYEELCDELGCDYVPPSSFAAPEQSYTFPWLGGNDIVNIVKFYHRELKRVTYYTFTDEFGTRKVLEKSEIDEDELVDGGFQLESEKTIKRHVVTEYIASGGGIMATNRIAGEHLPIIPQYGERQFVEDEEHYEGIVRLAKDPQRLRNFQMSYLADIVSRSGRSKPIFTDEQIAGYEDMYNLNGPDNNYPYLKQNHYDSQGNPLPVGAIGQTPDANVPPALVHSIQESRMAVDDVASPGLPQDITDPSLSGKAVQALQKRLDMQSYTYQDHHKYAMRRDGEVYASMFRDVMDSEQEITLVQLDGSTSRETINKADIDWSNMQTSIVNDVRKMMFDVYADIGPQFESVKAQSREEMKELVNGLPPGTTEHSIMLMSYLTMLDGSATEGIRDYARKQLILQGVEKPTTPEEEQMLQAAQQQQQPDANMVLAQAEMQKAQADMMGEENKKIELQLKAADAQAKHTGTREKLQSETALNMAKVQQGQQKINQDFALNLAKLELEANRDMNAQVQDNFRLRQQIGQGR